MLVLAFAVAIGYAVGCLSPAIWLARLLADIDIRDHGSGSAGGTNVLRVLGWKAGALVVLLDLGKGWGAAWLASCLPHGAVGWQEEGPPLAAGLAAIVGHVWPATARLRGGKGVATTGGVLLAVEPLAFAASVAVFAALLLATRIVSVASMGAAVSVPLILTVLVWTGVREIPGAALAWGGAATAVILLAHRHNIARLRAGVEPALPGRR